LAVYKQMPPITVLS